MAISLNSLRRTTALKPSIMVLYGVHGVGKTSLASEAPDPVFIQTEQGEGVLDIATFGLLKTFGEVMEAVTSLDSNEHDRKTAVLDSADWLEPMIWAQACADNGWANIEAPGYGKGYAATGPIWRELLDALARLRDERNMTIIILAHSKIKRFDSPENEPYDRYQPKLHELGSAILQEHADLVLFANYKVNTVKTEAGFKKKIARGVGGEERVLYTEERPAFLAKNRYAMPPFLPLDWHALAASIPFYNQHNPQTAATGE